MRQHLREMQLGDFVRLKRGHDLPADQRRAGGVPILGSFGVTGTHDEPKCEGPGVTIGRSGASIGVVSFIDEPYWPLNTCLYVTDFKGNDPLFAYHYLSTLDLEAFNSGSAQPSLNRNYVYLVPIAVPSLDEQQAIAGVLGALDDKIELNRRMNGTLEAMARALFKSWFVDFDPVHAKAAGKTPAHMDAATAALFPSRFTPEGLPEGWAPQPLDRFFQIVGGGTPKRRNAEFWAGAIPWFSVVDAPPQGEVFVHQTEASITEKGLARSSARLVPAGTTIISARGTVGKLALAARQMTFNQSCYGLVPESGVGSAFVYFTAVNLVDRLQGMAHGSVFATITRGTFGSIEQVQPSPGAFSAFSRVTMPLLNLISSNGKQNQTLAALRDTLLPKLMSGEVRVRDAERQIEKAL
ncbi:MAG: restriction endonuclease subunit S [Pseudomonadota bacterium]